ncbi:MAG: response regulator transcription factor [Candidatus Glassbacteria bacterium]
MRKVMILTSRGDVDLADEVARSLAKLDVEVLRPSTGDGGSLEEIAQAELFILVGRRARSIEGLAGTLGQDEMLSGVPRLVVTEEKALAGFDYCRLADDILVVPFSRGELVARVRMISWRNEKVDPSNQVKAGVLAINLSTYEVTVDGKPIDLTFKEFELLRYLVAHRRRVHTRRELLSRVWGEDYYGGARTVDVHIRRIRSKIETGNRTLIQTVRGVGYRFTG